MVVLEAPIHADFAVIEVTPDGLRVVEIVAGLSVMELQEMTGARLIASVLKP